MYLSSKKLIYTFNENKLYILTYNEKQKFSIKKVITINSNENIQKVSNNGQYFITEEEMKIKENKEKIIYRVYSCEKVSTIEDKISKLFFKDYFHNGKLKIVDMNNEAYIYNQDLLRILFGAIDDVISNDFDYLRDYFELPNHTLKQFERLVKEIINKEPITDQDLYDYLLTDLSNTF